MKRNPHIGSTLDEFLQEEGDLETARLLAIRDVIAWQVEQAMEKEGLTRAAMARRMHTTRPALERLLDSNRPDVSLLILQRAANAVGRRLVLSLE